MDFIALGKTNLLVSSTAFGAMGLDSPEIRGLEDAADEKVCAMVHQAYEGGINFFDVSHDSEVCERRLGQGLYGIRQNVFVASASSADMPRYLLADIEESLRNLQTDYIDLYQLQNPPESALTDSGDPLYIALKTLQEQGKVRHIGVVSDDLELVKKAVEGGLYEVVQFPFNMISGDDAHRLVEMCSQKEIGCIAMEPLNGGLVTNIPLAFGFFGLYENVVPLWGVRTQDELQQILYFNSHPPVVDQQFRDDIDFYRNFFN